MIVVNPATEEVIAELTEDTPESIQRKFARAVAAQREWMESPLTLRIEAIRRFGALLGDRHQKLAQILTSEVGKPITQSGNELKGMQARINFFLENTVRAKVPKRVFHDESQKLEEWISQEPLGVIANVSAWNYPYFVGSNVFLPALLTGNAVLYKPSEFASLTGLAIADLLHEAGIPSDVFIAVIGDGSVGNELLKRPVAGVFFTGSYATGLKIAESVAARMIRAQLELGGKDPLYVCEDVDIPAAAAATADGAFYNNGQSCCAVERLYVHRQIYSRFVKAFVETVKGFVLGDPMDSATYMGPVARKAQLEVLARQRRDAESKGAKLLCGGNRVDRRGFYFEPTVLIDADHRMDLMREETFGPMIGIQPVSGDEEALALMNDTSYGLTAGVYTPDQERAEKILARTNTGTVYWNCCDRVSPRLPWSGRGHSGIGTTLSTYGIQTFLQPKAWHLRG